jgi:hypothetical protein
MEQLGGMSALAAALGSGTSSPESSAQVKPMAELLRIALKLLRALVFRFFISFGQRKS